MTALPDGWKIVRFGDTFKVRYGKAIDKSLRKDSARYPVVGSAGIMTYTDEPLTEEPTIVIGRKGNVGSIQIFEEGCYPIDTTYYMQSSNQFNIKFLTLLLTSLELVKLDSSTATPSLRREDLENVSFFVPPLPEQQKIVEILEDHLARLDAALADVKQAKLKAARFRRSLLQSAFTGNLTCDGTRLMTEFPTGWDKKKMGAIGRYLNGKAFKSQDWRTSGRPIIRIQNLTGSGDEYNYFQGEIEERYVVKPGDLLFSWSATLGTYIWQGPEAVLNQHIFKVESLIDKRFHRYLLDFKIQEMLSKTHGSGMVHITKKSFDEIEVSIPPLPEQQKIVEVLEDYLSRLDASVAIADAMEKQSSSLRRSLLQAAFTGQLTKEVVSV